MTPDVLDEIRESCARVSERARSVRIDETRLSALAVQLAEAPAQPEGLDPAHHHVGGREETLAYVVCLDALNFGSGWFPHLRKRDGLSGYFTMAGGLKRRFESRGPWSAEELTRLRGLECARLFGQDPASEPALELMELFARSLRELGSWLLDRYGGSFAGPLEEAGGSAARLVTQLAEMPLYRDVSRYDGFDVPFYKRAQITAADLAAAFDGEGWGAFADLDRLTLFADNLVPHVLRLEGVLCYAPELARRIDSGELIASGAPEEVEIRATALHAVERCVAAMSAHGVETEARRLDALLWHRGQCPEVKSHPRHRTRTSYY